MFEKRIFFNRWSLRRRLSRHWGYATTAERGDLPVVLNMNSDVNVSTNASSTWSHAMLHTGWLRYHDRGVSFRICARALSYDVQVRKFHRMIFSSKPKNRTEVLNYGP